MACKSEGISIQWYSYNKQAFLHLPQISHLIREKPIHYLHKLTWRDALSVVSSWKTEINRNLKNKFCKKNSFFIPFKKQWYGCLYFSALKKKSELLFNSEERDSESTCCWLTQQSHTGGEKFYCSSCNHWILYHQIHRPHMQGCQPTQTHRTQELPSSL